MKITIDRQAAAGQAIEQIKLMQLAIFSATGQQQAAAGNIENSPVIQAIYHLAEIVQAPALLTTEIDDVLVGDAIQKRNLVRESIHNIDDDSPLGRLLLAADLYIEADDLITLSEASELTGRTLSDLSNKIARGQIKAYTDPDTINPTHARRVRQSAVLDLPPVRR